MRQVSIVLLAAATAACFGLRHSARRPEYPAAVTALTLVSQFSIAPLQRIPPALGLEFGGISALTMRPGSTQLLGLSDANEGGRIYRFTIEGLDGALRITPIAVIPLAATSPARRNFDQESFVALPGGEFLVSTEGSEQEPRDPPAIVRYGPHGEYLGILPALEHFAPERTGDATRGARANAGFESLTLSPDGQRLFVGAETSLRQDGDPASFEAGCLSRILEYSRTKDSFTPQREFAYPIDKLDKPNFAAGAFSNGLVDLLALDRTTFLALERGHIVEKGKGDRAKNQIRVFKISIAGATDISHFDSIKDHPEIVPASKTLLVDLSRIDGLSPELAPNLDNFEGMTFGPRLPDGRATVILVSDDNFNAAQRSWFLVFAVQ